LLKFVDGRIFISMVPRCTDFLVPASSFLIGVATIANLPGNFFRYNVSSTTSEADELALRSDFAMVGRDIQAATEHAVCGGAEQLSLDLEA
jgi:hypothetical protein